MSRRSSDWHIAGWPAYILAPLLVPIGLLFRLMRVGQTGDRTAAEVAAFIDDFISGTGGEWDWDDFTSVPLSDPELEAIRSEAELIRLPVDETGVDKLRELHDRALRIQREREFQFSTVA